MIAAYLYQPIYLLIVVILTVIALRRYSACPLQSGKQSIYPIVLTVLMILFVGFRPISRTYFVDMIDYHETFQYYSDFSFDFNYDTDNIIFDNLFLFLSSSGVSSTVFFITIAAIYFLGIYLSSRLLFAENTMLAILVYLAAFSTFSYATNGIKAGAGAVLFLVALGFFCNHNKILTCLFLLMSIGFHHSMILPICAFFIVLIIKNPKVYIYVWFFSFLVALCHITFFQGIFANLSDEQGAMYLLHGLSGDKDVLTSGFRMDFIIYGFVPVLVGIISLVKGYKFSTNYKYLFNTYTLVNSIWMLCMYASFTNRIAYLSWLMYPFVLIYPFVGKDKFISNPYRLKEITYLHLAFTLFMTFVYYA